MPSVRLAMHQSQGGPIVLCLFAQFVQLSVPNSSNCLFPVRSICLCLFSQSCFSSSARLKISHFLVVVSDLALSRVLLHQICRRAAEICEADAKAKVGSRLHAPHCQHFSSSCYSSLRAVRYPVFVCLKTAVLKNCLFCFRSSQSLKHAKVSLDHVKQAIEDLMSSSKVNAIKHSSLQEQ